MTVNLLSQRIKAAKRELTALKTAHSRGLGNLKIYNEKFTNVPSFSGALTITINFSTQYAPYPFFQLVKYETVISVSSNQMFGILDGYYTNNGFTAIVTAPYDYAWTFPFNGFYINSTSPVISVSYS